MPRSLAVGRMLASRRSPAPLRRYLQGRPNTIAEKIADLSEAHRAQISKHVAEIDAELQSKLVKNVDAYLQSSNGQGLFGRVLTFCRLPKGERMDKLIWRSSLAAAMLGSVVLGHCEAHKCLCHYEYQKEAAAANHAP